MLQLNKTHGNIDIARYEPSGPVREPYPKMMTDSPLLMLEFPIITEPTPAFILSERHHCANRFHHTSVIDQSPLPHSFTPLPLPEKFVAVNRASHIERNFPAPVVPDADVANSVFIISMFVPFDSIPTPVKEFDISPNEMIRLGFNTKYVITVKIYKTSSEF